MLRRRLVNGHYPLRSVCITLYNPRALCITITLYCSLCGWGQVVDNIHPRPVLVEKSTTCIVIADVEQSSLSSIHWRLEVVLLSLMEVQVQSVFVQQYSTLVPLLLSASERPGGYWGWCCPRVAAAPTQTAMLSISDQPLLSLLQSNCSPTITTQSLDPTQCDVNPPSN